MKRNGAFHFGSGFGAAAGAGAAPCMIAGIAVQPDRSQASRWKRPDTNVYRLFLMIQKSAACATGEISPRSIGDFPDG